MRNHSQLYGQTIRLAGASATMLVVAALGAIHAEAQNSNQLPAASQATESAQGVPNAQNKIRVQTKEVVAVVTVLNKHGDLVLDLAQSDFHVYDNRAER